MTDPRTRKRELYLTARKSEKRQGRYALLIKRFGPFRDATHAHEVLQGKSHAAHRGYSKVWIGKATNEWLHRAVMMVKLGRGLRAGEVVHHRDGNPRNNQPENLEVFPDGLAHWEKHGRGAGVYWRRGMRWYTTGPHKGRGVARVMVEGALGRRLRANEMVWHINRDSGDDRLENLEVISRKEMARRLRPWERAARKRTL